MQKNTWNIPYCEAKPLCQKVFLALIIIGFTLFTAPPLASANPKYASIVMDADTGLILHQSSADKVLHPASLTKMMTLMLTFDALEQGTLKLHDRIIISKHAASMVPSKLGLKPGQTIRVEDAIYALVTKSANDIAVALAEKIAGTEYKFSLMMTVKARKIGMNNTRFRNASGLHNRHQVSTARDMAKLSRQLLTAYPQYYHYFSTRSFTYNGTTYKNHNRLMDSYQGMDGLKTGYTEPSGFNLAASAVRNNKRLIGVVFGGRTSRTRDAHMKTLLDRSFAKAEQILLAANVPLPPRKPTPSKQLAMLSNIETAAGLIDIAADGAEENTKWAPLNPVLQSSSFSKMIGEGDYDPAVSKRLETGLLAISAMQSMVNKERTQKVAYNFTPDKNQIGKNWSIQIGAFTSRTKTDRALHQALKSIPSNLSDAAPVIAPLRTKDGWLFRARLSGYSKLEAQKACKHIKPCMIISPHAY